MNKKVSIVVPVYNSHSTLPKCLESLILQSYQDLEIICVNDKSKDNSVDIIKRYQLKDSRIILIDHEQNKNAGGARNSGIKAASGTYVCFVDNDDWLSPDAIETLVTASEECKIDIVVPQWCQYWSKTHYVNKTNLIVESTKEKCCEHALLYGYRMLGCLFRRDLFFKNDLFFPEKTFFEDNAIAISLLFSANEIKVIDKVLYFYQMVEGSSSRSISLVKIADRIKTSDMFITNMERLGYVNSDNKLLVNYNFLCFSYHTIRMLGSIGTKEAKGYLKEVANKIVPLLPNKYLSTYKKGYLVTLTHPFICFQIWKVAYQLKRILNK